MLKTPVKMEWETLMAPANMLDEEEAAAAAAAAAAACFFFLMGGIDIYISNYVRSTLLLVI
jgi:hypothetical protein